MALFSDLNIFTPTDKPLVEDAEAIYQSLFSILRTRSGERIFRPDFGVDLSEYLFELADDATALEIFRRVTEGIEANETRVTIDYSQSKVVPDIDNNEFLLQLVFLIPGLSDQEYNITGRLRNE